MRHTRIRTSGRTIYFAHESSPDSLHHFISAVSPPFSSELLIRDLKVKGRCQLN